MCFHRDATNLADGLSCVLQWVCCGAGCVQHGAALTSSHRGHPCSLLLPHYQNLATETQYMYAGYFRSPATRSTLMAVQAPGKVSCVCPDPPLFAGEKFLPASKSCCKVVHGKGVYSS